MTNKSYFDIIHAMRQEYLQEYKGIYDSTRPRIDYWANEKYGFQMESDGTGEYTANYTITDPKKFLIFKLKYWQ